jgi:hypothetical protein
VLPALRRPIEQALIEWDWRMQDGIETERMPSTFAAAIEKNLNRGDELFRDLRAAGDVFADELTAWQVLRGEWQQLAGSNVDDESRWEDLWRRVHWQRRRIALANPLVRQLGPLVFTKLRDDDVEQGLHRFS